MKKRVIAILIAGMMLAGCGKKEEPAVSENESVSEETVTEEPTGAEVTEGAEPTVAATPTPKPTEGAEAGDKEEPAEATATPTTAAASDKKEATPTPAQDGGTADVTPTETVSENIRAGVISDNDAEPVAAVDDDEDEDDWDDEDWDDEEEYSRDDDLAYLKECYLEEVEFMEDVFGDMCLIDDDGEDIPGTCGCKYKLFNLGGYDFPALYCKPADQDDAVIYVWEEEDIWDLADGEDCLDYTGNGGMVDYSTIQRQIRDLR